MRRNYTRRYPILVIGPSIAYIPLPNDAFSVIEVDDLDEIGAYTWHLSRSGGGKNYAWRRKRKTEDASCAPVAMHKILCPSPIVDHKNGNGLDNRKRGNLRPATHQQNNRNRPKGGKNTSGYKGVSWNKGKWQAQLKICGKYVQLGRFDTASEAGEAYQSFAKKMFREFYRS